jgi:ArsR family metal-binding transcriptional regulator
MLVKSYKLEVTCERGCCSCWLKATATLSEDIGKAITGLAAVIENARYVPGENKINFFKDNVSMSIFPSRIEIKYIENENRARTLMEWVKDMINKKYSELN